MSVQLFSLGSLSDGSEKLLRSLVVRGSHRAGVPPSHPPIFEGNKPERLACPPGSVVLFRSDLWHGAADNTHAGGKQRYIMQIHYGNDCAHRSTPPPRHAPLHFG